MNASISLLDHLGALRAACVCPVPEWEGWWDMQVLYARCAAVDVGKDVIAVAVRLPGDGSEGRQTLKAGFPHFWPTIWAPRVEGGQAWV